ncbi:hypothetical protein Tco_0513196, partial [Tanacetum coccineum]
EHEVENGDKVVKKELIVALRGEIYFVKFITNPEEDDIEPGVVLRRSFLRLTKGIVDFENGIITIYPEPDTFNDVDSDKANDSESEITQSPSGSSDTSEWSENSRSFEDSGR